MSNPESPKPTRKKTPPDIRTFPLFTNKEAVDKHFDFNSGAVFLIDKPKSWSSFRPVGLIRKLTGIRKVGHAGTLDPMATGLLIICCGKSTKSIDQIQAQTKRYTATIQLGSKTISYDAETDIDETTSFKHVTERDIIATIKSDFLGDIKQEPPMYSAIWHKGERLYHLARRGETVERKERDVTIHSFDLISYDSIKGELKVDIVCSKGTYIRSIANDIGLKLDTFGHLTALRRTQIGSFSVNDAITMEQLVKDFDQHGEIDLS